MDVVMTTKLPELSHDRLLGSLRSCYRCFNGNVTLKYNFAVDLVFGGYSMLHEMGKVSFPAWLAQMVVIKAENELRFTVSGSCCLRNLKFVDSRFAELIGYVKEMNLSTCCTNSFVACTARLFFLIIQPINYWFVHVAFCRCHRSFSNWTRRYSTTWMWT